MSGATLGTHRNIIRAATYGTQHIWSHCRRNYVDAKESESEAKTVGSLALRLKVLSHPALLVVDEIGYLPVRQDGAMLFFQLTNARDERGSAVLAQSRNVPFLAEGRLRKWVGERDG